MALGGIIVFMQNKISILRAAIFGDKPIFLVFYFLQLFLFVISMCLYSILLYAKGRESKLRDRGSWHILIS